MKYTIEDAKRIFSEYNLILDETTFKNANTKMLCHDVEGYKYETSLSYLNSGRKPRRYTKFNRYTIENIQHTLDLETDGVKILSNQFIGNRNKLQFKCTCGKLFKADMLAFVSDGKRYCNSCSKSKRFESNKYIEAIKKRCDELNYTLLDFNINKASDVFRYICNKHIDKGELTSSYSRMITAGNGCKYCGIESRGIKHRVSREDIIKTLNGKGFSYVNHDYVRRSSNSSSKVRIHCICNNHPNKGIQYLDYYNLQHNKAGCKYCVGKDRTLEDLQSEFNKNYRGITIINFVNYRNITVRCNKCGYVWETMGVNINTGHGCPKCNMSNYEKRVESVLLDNDIKYIPQYKYEDCRDINPLPFDFYLIDTGTLIEVDGQGHYYPVNYGGISDKKAEEHYETTQRHDKIKSDYCRSNSINLIRIPYYIIDNKEFNLTEYIMSEI